jgi:hypothetical protein
MFNPFISNVMDWSNSSLILPLTDAALKSTLLLAAAFAVIALGRKQSPAWRGWVLWLALFFTPGVFALSFLVPAWRWDGAWVLGGGRVFTGELAAAQSSAGNPEPPPDSNSSYWESAPADAGIPWASLIFLTWATGTGAACLRSIYRSGRSLKARRDCQEVRRGTLVNVLDQERLQAGLRRRPKLYAGNQWAMPATWGLLHPAILLPREASSWSAGRLRHVLWHEMAHIS